MKRNLRNLIGCALFAALPLLAAGPAVTVVTGPKPAKLEQMAAAEVATQLGNLFDAKVNTTTKFQPGGNVVLIGNPKSNPAIAKLMVGKWPKLSDQGHMLKSVNTERGTVLVIGGGSPVATYWAAVELGHHFGVRRLLHADFPPLKKPKFSLGGLDLKLEPSLKIRAWRTIDAGPASQESWSLAEHRVRLRQLAKLKFNCVVLAIHAWQPFVHFEHGGIKKKTGVLWHGKTFRVDGETAGRAAFGRDRVFNNPDFSDAKNYRQRLEVGIKLIKGIIAEAEVLGMRTVLENDPMVFPIEFAPRFKEAWDEEAWDEEGGGVSFRVLITGLGKPEMVVLRGLIEAQLAALRGSYPTLGGITQRAHSFFNKKTTDIFFKHGKMMKASKCTLLEIGNRLGNVFPQFNLGELHASVKVARAGGRDGFVASCRLADDLNTSVYYLSRAGFDKNFTPKQAMDGLVTPISGPGVSARIAIGFEHLAKASALVDKNDPTIASLRPEVIMRHFALNEPVPEWWGEAKGGFAMAMNEMYRANTRARGGAREYSLYLAKRFEFALHYFTCLEATRLAGHAKAKGDRAAQVEQLEIAVEAIHNALGAMADVDRNNADRGVIAVLNEYGFRPLLKELEKADQ